MTTIDLETTGKKRAHWASPLIFGNARMTPDPAKPGRYRVEDAGDDGRLLGYLVTEISREQTVSLNRISEGLDELLKPCTVRC